MVGVGAIFAGGSIFCSAHFPSGLLKPQIRSSASDHEIITSFEMIKRPEFALISPVGAAKGVGAAKVGRGSGSDHWPALASNTNRFSSASTPTREAPSPQNTTRSE